MATMAASRKTVSIHDYPEHLNPFHEDDVHNKIRFWTLGKKLTRSNSITFSGIKEIKNSWAFRSFMKKGKKQSSTQKSEGQVNGEPSPIIYRRALQYSLASNSGSRSTVASPERYVYGGSITPLPRSRFQERLRSSSQYDANSLSMTPRMARSEVTGSRLSVESTNPFDEDGPVPPVRTRRKKKRAPPPPPLTGSASTSAVADISIDSEISEMNISEVENKPTKADGDVDLEEMNLNIELKIVEDEDKGAAANNVEITNNNPAVETIVVAGQVHNEPEHTKDNEQPPSENGLTVDDSTAKTSGSEENILNSVSFPKIDIIKYRRNSSVNEDDIRLRRGNLEDFHELSNKRSKSLNNNLDTTYLTYDINLNEETNKDANGNEEPQRVICKYNETARKQSIDTISSTEKEFLEIDKATRELEREISKLNSALNEDDIPSADDRLSVSEIKRRFDKGGASSPNPIPKPRRSHYGGSNNSP